MNVLHFISVSVVYCYCIMPCIEMFVCLFVSLSEGIVPVNVVIV